MADIFSIKMNEAYFQIGKKKHRIHDPSFGSKNALLKKWRDLDAKREGMSATDFLEQNHLINVEMLKQYLPTLTNNELEKLGQAYTAKLMEQMTVLSEKLFGAVVEKVETK